MWWRIGRVSHLRRSEIQLLVTQPLWAGLTYAAPTGLVRSGRGVWWRRFALENAGGAGGCGKAAAEPPHSKMGWAWRRLRTLRDGDRRGRRASRWGLGAKWLREKLRRAQVCDGQFGAVASDINPQPSQWRRRMGHPQMQGRGHGAFAFDTIAAAGLAVANG
jgi:hypothetical protein